MPERVFSYRNLATLERAMAWVPLILLGATPLFTMKAPDSQIDFILGGIAALGVILTIKPLMQWLNERIVLSDQTITWYGPTGRLKVQSPISGIEKGSLTESSPTTVNVNGMRFTSRGWQLRTGNGPIKFRTAISDGHELVMELERLGAAADGARGGYPLICTYHSFTMILASLIVFTLFVGFSFATVSMLITPPIDANTHQPEPFWFPLIFGLATVALAVVVVFLILTLVNERISIVGDNIEWKDRYGRFRVRCSAADVLPGSFNSEVRANSDGSSITLYSVGTRDGVIKFDGNIANADVLARRFEAMAGRSNQDSAPSTAGWTSDPLKDPDQHNLPIS